MTTHLPLPNTLYLVLHIFKPYTPHIPLANFCSYAMTALRSRVSISTIPKTSVVKNTTTQKNAPVRFLLNLLLDPLTFQ